MYLLTSVPKRFNIIQIDNYTPETACQCLPYRCSVIYNASRRSWYVFKSVLCELSFIFLLDVPNPESESFTTFLHWMK